MTEPRLAALRREFHVNLTGGILTVGASGTPSNADSSSKASKRIALGVLEGMGRATEAVKLPGQTMGSGFETVCATFLEAAFAHLTHLRPGVFEVRKGGAISNFEQYAHLDELEAISRANRDLATALGSDYLIKPDIVISKAAMSDAEINSQGPLVDENVARLSGLRAQMGAMSTLHASVSCKWTLRSDRAQNARSEGLNLVRNRKGRLPHIAVVTGEPLPSRISSLALGTGDIDCVYHIALDELHQTLTAHGDAGYLDQLEMMVDGKRLKDIADLPLDLIV